MLVIKLLAVVAAIVLFVMSIQWFNRHCVGKFGHAFFTKAAFGITTLALGLLYFGYLWRQSAMHSHGDVLNGLVLMVLGTTLAAWLVYINVRRTNALYGIGGSIAQIGIFSALAAVWVPLMFLVLLLGFLSSFGARPVYVVNR